ncbi:MAG: helix-hairpin-helix domain-containing protein [candidate division Zixibacteria bacterium]|nr:helix-hairpin-helix domain-containing protein [candidate division Zixibacteria bacterium]
MMQFFEFSKAQMKTLVLLAGLLAAGGSYLIIRDFFLRSDRAPRPWRVKTLEGYRPLLVLDLNRAPADSLELIPGIGPVLAERIVSFRRQHGPFAAVESLTQVPGFGPAVMAGVKPYLKAARP